MLLYVTVFTIFSSKITNVIETSGTKNKLKNDEKALLCQE